ncbi:MAG: hypothetical protein GX100_02285 [candidate division WS1 bacterium]|nr:hypothetical protein [candidate division WS1 bacterium]
MYRTEKKHKILALLIAVCFLAGLMPWATTEAHALNLFSGLLGDLLKVFGIGWVVSHFSNDINNAINNFLDQRELGVQGMTKVVPILNVGVGGGTAVGAAQVMGPEAQVKTVRAVAQIEWSPGEFRGRYLVPVTTDRDLTSSVKGVDGVGISAVVSFRL